MADIDEIPVLVADLRMILRAVNSAYGAQAAWDLVHQYRGMGEGPEQPSTLTTSLERARNRVQGYLSEAEKEEVDGDQT